MRNHFHSHAIPRSSCDPKVQEESSDEEVADEDDAEEKMEEDDPPGKETASRSWKVLVTREGGLQHTDSEQ